MVTDGSLSLHVRVPTGGSALPASATTVAARQHFLMAGRLRDGDVVLLLAAGIGYTWAATALRWGPAGLRQQESPAGLRQQESRAS